MSKRKYTHIQELLPEIRERIAKGKSYREIEGLLGRSGDRPIHNLFKCERRKEKNAAASIAPRPKGHPRNDAAPKNIVAEQAYEIKRLKMEKNYCGIFCDPQKGSEGICSLRSCVNCFSISA